MNDMNREQARQIARAALQGYFDTDRHGFAQVPDRAVQRVLEALERLRLIERPLEPSEAAE